ncbi:MAG: hypothetical protein A2156_03720 [Deltaproteobacteria bacterium RBG_16_48_10]|nr:MAG: hypothetical protein A2156_03720 [Deltaproteobacteria bacterium RBG_16_48_10]
MKAPRGVIVNGLRKESLRGAQRRGNLMRLLHFVRNDTSLDGYLFRSFTIISLWGLFTALPELSFL